MARSIPPSASTPRRCAFSIIFTVIFGVGYPLAVTAVAQIPGLQSRADGSLIKVGRQGRRLER